MCHSSSSFRGKKNCDTIIWQRNLINFLLFVKIIHHLNVQCLVNQIEKILLKNTRYFSITLFFLLSLNNSLILYMLLDLTENP